MRHRAALRLLAVAALLALAGCAEQQDAPAEAPTPNNGRVCLRKAGSKAKHVSCFASGAGGSTESGEVATELQVLVGVAAAAGALIVLGCFMYSCVQRGRHSGASYAALGQEDDWTGSMGMEQWDEAGKAYSENQSTEPRWRRAWSRCRDLCAGRLEISPNAKVLIVAIVAFASITVAQTVAAVFANSLALLGDCASMGVDTLTYCGNLYAEVVPQGSPRDTKKAQLLASAASLLVLSSVQVHTRSPPQLDLQGCS